MLTVRSFPFLLPKPFTRSHDLTFHSIAKRYTLTIKDTLLPKRSDGRDQSTISYEFDFTVPSSSEPAKSTSIFIPWHDLRATYRGKDKPDALDLNPKRIRRFSILMRSFFGDQEGDFDLTVKSIAAIVKPGDRGTAVDEVKAKIKEFGLYDGRDSPIAEKGRDIEAAEDENRVEKAVEVRLKLEVRSRSF
jgi:Complex I intermediate-associated protein 30 (CIA30)